MRAARGFTLLELLVATTIMAMLVIAAIPLATTWVYSSQTHSAKTLLSEAYDLAKATALMNPNQIASPAAAAGLKILTSGTTTTLLVCVGSAAQTTCASGGTSVVWSATYSGLVSTTINNVLVTSAAPVTLDIDNRGEALALTGFTLARGGSSNNESGTLY